MTQYYKILSADGQSIHGGDLQWSLPKLNKKGKWVAGKWHKVKGKIVVCRNGLHVTTTPYKYYTSMDVTCWEAECRGDSDTRGDKTAFREVRLTQPAPHPQWWLDAKAFIADIPNTPFLKPDGNPLPEWKLFTAPTLAEAWAAAWAEAGAAAWAAAWDAEHNWQNRHLAAMLGLPWDVEAQP